MREDNAIKRHCAEIERCNQRGGRMLSIVDLIEAGTISRELAAYALAAIGGGASFLVGARPGGAGKTTVMCAVLNFVPRDVELTAADGMEAIAAGMKVQARITQAPASSFFRGLILAPPRRCYICHEIGRGPYYAYLWGAELRAYFELPRAEQCWPPGLIEQVELPAHSELPRVGHMLATNLHADTYEEAHSQICIENGVSESAFRRVHLMFFLSVRWSGGRALRKIKTVWESGGTGAHRQVFAASQSKPLNNRSRHFDDQGFAKAQDTIERILESGARTIEDVRTAVLSA